MLIGAGGVGVEQKAVEAARGLAAAKRVGSGPGQEAGEEEVRVGLHAASWMVSAAGPGPESQARPAGAGRGPTGAAAYGGRTGTSRAPSVVCGLQGPLSHHDQLIGPTHLVSYMSGYLVQLGVIRDR